MQSNSWFEKNSNKKQKFEEDKEVDSKTKKKQKRAKDKRELFNEVEDLTIRPDYDSI